MPLSSELVTPNEQFFSYSKLHFNEMMKRIICFVVDQHA